MSTLAAAPGKSRATTGVSPWLSFAIGALILLGMAFATLRHDSLSAFGTYWVSGRAVSAGMNPYALYPETYRSNSGGQILADLNLNPPCTLPIFQALALLPRAVYGQVWTTGSVALFLLGAGLLLCRDPRMHPYQVLWLLASFPVLVTIIGGQIYGVLFLLACLAVIFSRNGNLTAAAIAIGLLVAIKPTMGLWIPFLWIAGHRIMAYVAAAVTFIASLLPVLLYGPRIYREWLGALHGDIHWMFPTNIALIPTFTRHGHHTFGVVLAGAVALSIAWWLWKKQPGLLRTHGIAACTGILCAPLAWFTYILVIAPFFVARPWSRVAAIAGFLLFIPTGFLAIGGSTAYLLIVGIMLWTFLHSERNPIAAHPA